ncbi:MAG: NADH-quinone oxidoreductase subunit N [Phycisphaerales bacterium]|nr:NADH-quinone oxidoreductase subunit N [Phycisphaerales bacterium]
MSTPLLMTMLGAADQPLPMVEKLRYLVPEMILFIATVVVMIVGLSPNRAVRRSCAAVSIAGLAAAGAAAAFGPAFEGGVLPGLMPFAKVLIAAVGVLLVMVVTGTVDRDFEGEVSRGAAFDALRGNRAEFYAFALFSLTGLMLVASADDLIWLFLALELTSLPTYVMVSISTARSRSQEAGVKYFFLGAFGAAMFLYGFAMLYGATGTTALYGPGSIAEVLAARAASGEGLGMLATLGLVLSIVGVSFKIAAVPMHFYTPDVYEGAASSVSAFLAFVPKAAGFLTIILLLAAVGWHFGPAGTALPEPIRVTLWVMAALTMTVGNVLAVMQKSVKRMLAYSSIAHSGYMLVGVIVGPGSQAGATGSLQSNGLAAVLFYLLCYGFMNLGAFAVLAVLEKRSGGEREEIETVEDLKGLCRTQPLMGWTMVLCALSLLGLPPLLGFWGKFFLFTSAIGAGEIALVVVMGLNSAIAAYYYLRLVGAPLLESSDAGASFTEAPAPARKWAAVLSAASVLVLVLPAGWLIQRANNATGVRPPTTPMKASGGTADSASTSAPAVRAAR